MDEYVISSGHMVTTAENLAFDQSSVVIDEIEQCGYPREPSNIVNATTAAKIVGRAKYPLTCGSLWIANSSLSQTEHTKDSIV